MILYYKIYIPKFVLHDIIPYQIINSKLNNAHS